MIASAGARARRLVDGAEVLFGAQHESLGLVHEPERPGRWMPQERRFNEFDPCTSLEGTGEFAGAQVLANFWLQTLRPTTAEPILLAGERVAATRQRFGRGQAAAARQLSRPQRAGTS